MSRPYLFVILLLSNSCSDVNKRTFESSEKNFEMCIQPYDAVMYADFLILLENKFSKYSYSQRPETYNNSNFLVINYLTNEIDTTLQNALNKIGISKLYVKNDSLFAFSFFDSTWLKWENAWKTKTPFTNQYYHNFENSYLKNHCDLIYEDDVYFIYSYDYGDRGYGVFFLHKISGLLNGYTMPVATSVYKDTIGYIVAGVQNVHDIWDGDSWETYSLTCVVRIKQPGKLPVVPENQIIYEKDSLKYNLGEVKVRLSDYLYNEIMDDLPDSLQVKHQFILKEIEAFNKRRDINFSKRHALYEQIDSLYQFDDNVDYLLDKSNWYEGNKTICYGSFIHQNKLIHIIKDSLLYFAESINNKLIPSQNPVQANQFPTGFVIADWQIKDKKLLIFKYKEEEDSCTKVTSLIMDNHHIKRYNFE